MRARFGRAGKPAWWPEGEPWPPGPRSARWHRRRTAFGRLVGVVAVVVLGLCVAGALALASAIAHWFSASPGQGATYTGGLLAAGFVFVLVAILAFAGLTRGIVRPLGGVMEAADRVASGAYDVRVPVEGPPRLRALARSFNTMTERLQSADRERRDLMADIAHELRTPLTVMQGTLEGILDGVYPRDDERVRQLLGDTQLLARLIEDLRTLALSESGVLKLEREPVDLMALIRDAMRTFADAAAAGQVVVTLETAGDPGLVEIDPLRIREVMANLLSNAIRHTPSAGRVTIAVSWVQAGTVTVAVRDTGEGMNSDELAHAFQRFHKGAGSRGSGLGLAIARSLVAAHGGEIGAASAPGQGTTVTFTLPRVSGS